MHDWAPLPALWIEVTTIPLLDAAHVLPNGRKVFARLTYNDARKAAERVGARLISERGVRELGRVGLQLVPFLGTPKAEVTLEHSMRHDAVVWRQLEERGWDGKQAVAGAGKHWIAGAKAGWSRLMGWDVDGPGPGTRLWQNPTDAHFGGMHHDDGTTTMLERDLSAGAPKHPPHTVRRGDIGCSCVAMVQRIVGATADGIFGPLTERKVKAWQAAHGLVADGIFGPKSWRAAGFEVDDLPSHHDPRAPACRAALRDADKRWPSRRRASDGIMGDAAHQARPSGHNAGNAVDITHDPSGFDCEQWAESAYHDARAQYVIWNARIINKSVSPDVWRPYNGANPHRHHMHIEIVPSRREDASPWPWAAG